MAYYTVTGSGNKGGQPSKRSKIACPCRVCSHDCLMEEESIQCDGCQCWMHQQCINMTLAQYTYLSAHSFLQFFCLHCSHNVTGRYDFLASLARIAAHSPNLPGMRSQAESERNLLTIYKVGLPPVASLKSTNVRAHQPSVDMLHDHSQWLLSRFVPAIVGGDGNCLFRSVSLALFGRESDWDHLRLLVSIEVLLSPTMYDDGCEDYYAPYRYDKLLVLSNYHDFVLETVKNGSYSDMLTVLGLSSVVHKPIQTHWPVMINPNQPSPMTKLVVGRNVQTVNPVNILWTTAADYAGKGQPVALNHFVPLITMTADSNCVAVVGTDAEQDGEIESESAEESELDCTTVVDGPQLNEKFLSNFDCIKYLCDNSHQPVYDSVPNGIKSNVWVKVRMTRDHNFWDDCGAWSGSSGKKTYHMPNTLVELRLMTHGLYGIRRQFEGKTQIVQLEPQPDDVVIIHRLYSKLKRAETFQRRITYLEGAGAADFFLAEYLGIFPSTVESHGNAVHLKSQYVRTKPSVLATIATALKTTKAKPTEVYHRLKDAWTDDQSRPRDKKQVTNCTY